MATAITFNEQQFEKRLLSLKDTQESISTLSSWCLQQHQHHKKIVSLWLQVLKKVKIEQRLTLFYLANDVIQYSKRKGYDFVESWGTALQRATTMVRDDKVKNKILRLFKIWDERSIYDEAFLVDLSGLLSSRGPARSNSQEAQDFQPPVLIAKIRSCKELEDDTDFKLKVVNESHLSLSDADAMRSSLKDRKHGADIEAEVDDGIGKMNDYIDALKAEIKERASVIELLDHAEAFYENQRGEAKIVCNAYRNFGTRVKALKRKLDELITTLPSPIPSPDVDAPSPSPESDIDLPEENSSGKCYSTSASFIGSLVMPDKVRLSESTPEKSGGTSSSSSTDYDSPKHTYRPPTPPNRKYPQKPSPKPAKSPSPKYQTPTKQVTPEPYRPVITTTAPPAPYSVKPNNKTTSHTGTIKSSYEPVPSSTYQTTKTTSQSYTAPVTTSSAVTTSYLPNSNSSPIYSPTYPPTTYSSNTAPKYTSNNSHSYPPVTPPPYTGSYPPTTTTTQSYLPNNIPTYPTSSDPLVNTNYNSTPPFPPPDYSLPPPIVHNQHTTHTPDYSVPPPNPFYQSSNTTMPPLLGEDFPVNGTDSFLQQPPPPQSSSKRESSGSNLPGLGSGFSTFMGSSNLPFDIQKGGIFSDTSCDTPASPIAEHSVDDNSQNYLSDSNTTTQVSGQGKPIEVISMSTPTDISEILKALGMPTGGRGTSTTNSTVSPTSSVGPRPVTSNVLDDVYQEEELEKHWNQPPLLPSKFPTWGQPDWVDTPTSPPPYEKSGYVDPVEYDESDSLILAEQDTDLRSLAIDRVPHGDIDHRNLISLTSSPREETCWSSSKDTDYRRIALVSKAGAQDNVESVDMEMSSEEEMDNMTTTTTTAAAATVGLAEVVKAASMSTTTVSFSLNTNTKVLPESPLIEKEEVKPKKPPPKLDILTPPHDLLSDPPLVPDVAEIFPELLDSNDSGVADEPDNNTVPLLPPPPPAPLAIPIPKAAPPAITIPKTAPPAIPIPKAAPPAIPIPTAAPPALPIPKVEDIKKINKVVEEFQSPAPPPLPLGPPPFMHPPQHRMKVNFINTRPPPPPPPPPPPRFFPRRGNFRHCGPRFRPPPPSMPPQQPPPGPPVQMDMSFRGRPPFRPPWRPRFPTW